MDDAAKAALTEKKGKAALTRDAPQDAPENNDGAVNNKCPRTENPPTLKPPFGRAALRTSLGPPQVSPPRKLMTSSRTARS